MGRQGRRQRATGGKYRFSADLNGAPIGWAGVAGVAMAEQRGLDWRWLALVWGLVAATFIGRALYLSPNTPLILDTDDAMRLVVVRDFLAGQGWWDNIQHRLDAPYGAELHWSRLADLPLAGLTLLLRPFVGAFAETLAAWVLPLIYLGGLLGLSAGIALKLVGRAGVLPALVLPALSMTVLSEFVPGRVDHHSLQILLLLATAWAAIAALDRARWGVGAGVAAATAIAIGIEGVPGVAAAVLAFGLMWVTSPARAAAMRWFGASFAVATVVHLLIGVAPGRWLTPMCDGISIVYAAAAVGTGVLFVALSLVPTRGVGARLALGLVAGAIVGGGLALAFPQCLGGPYAGLDPYLITHWIDRIGEAQPWWVSFARDPVYPMAVLVPPVLALVACVVRVRRGGEGAAAWWVYAAFLVIAVAVELLQIRGSRMAVPLAVPGCAWVIAEAVRWWRAERAIGRFAGVALAWIASAGLGVAALTTGVVLTLPPVAVATSDPGAAARRACIMPAAFTELAAMPKTNVMAPVDLGSHILAFTPHAVVAAPYHRAQRGVRAAFDFFNGPIGEAREILRDRGVTLVVICPAMPEVRGQPDAAADAFAKLFAAGTLPGWLTEVSAPGAVLRVFRVGP